MTVLNWLLSNWQGVISVVTMLLAAAVAVLHMAHADSTASSIQNIEDVLSKLLNKPNPPSS